MGRGGAGGRAGAGRFASCCRVQAWRVAGCLEAGSPGRLTSFLASTSAPPSISISTISQLDSRTAVISGVRPSWKREYVTVCRGLLS